MQNSPSPFANAPPSSPPPLPQSPAGRPPISALKPPPPPLDETYHDHLHDDIEDDEAFRRKNTGGVTNPFPEKLMEVRYIREER